MFLFSIFKVFFLQNFSTANFSGGESSTPINVDTDNQNAIVPYEGGEEEEEFDEFGQFEQLRVEHTPECHLVSTKDDDNPGIIWRALETEDGENALCFIE